MTLEKKQVSVEQDSTSIVTPGYRIGVVDNVVFVTFEQFEKHFLTELFAEGMKVHRKLNRLLVIIVLVAPDAEPPNRIFVEENMRMLRDGKNYFAKVVAVLQGSGIKKAFIRSIASNIMLALNDRGDLAVVDTVTNALLACQKHLQLSPAEIMAKAASLGFLV